MLRRADILFKEERSSSPDSFDSQTEKEKFREDECQEIMKEESR